MQQPGMRRCVIESLAEIKLAREEETRTTPGCTVGDTAQNSESALPTVEFVGDVGGGGAQRGNSSVIKKYFARKPSFWKSFVLEQQASPDR
jgi:hypothetical protein